MPLFPDSEHPRYEGSPAACRFLFVLGVLTVVPASIHLFLPDGGAGTIAGLDLSGGGAAIVGVFAWAGATQLVHGLAMLAVATRFRPMVPLFLALVLVERIVMSLNWWVLKPPAADHRPPEVWATLVLLPLLAYFLAQSLRRAPSAGFAARVEAGAGARP